MKKFNKLYELESLCLQHGYHINLRFLLDVDPLELFPVKLYHFWLSCDYDDSNKQVFYTVSGSSLLGWFIIKELPNVFQR